MEGNFERLPSCVRCTNTCCTIDSACLSLHLKLYVKGQGEILFIYCTPISYLHLIMRAKERNKHWMLTGCHPPLLLLSEGSRLPNPWACLTIPLPPCRTPTPLFWSQGILEENSLLTSNCYHLGLLLSFLKETKNPTCQSATRVALGWLFKWCLFRWGRGGGAQSWQLTVGRWHPNVSPHTNADCSSLEGFYSGVWFLLTSTGMFYNRAHLWTKCVT